MQPAEYEILARVEDGHWWYLALRDVLRRVLPALDPPLPARPSVLDAGCGSGANLRLLTDLLRPSYLGGFDRSPRAVELARAKAPAADVYESDLCDPELRAPAFDLVVSMDVLYIPGIEASFDGLRRIVSHVRPGGRLVLNLPAYDWLYSEHDVAIHTKERYTRSRVAALLDRLGLRPERLTYRVCLLFPLVVLARLPRLRRPGGDAARASSDLHRVPSPAVNRLLFSATRLEHGRIARGGRFPWGSSVFAVGRKPGP